MNDCVNDKLVYVDWLRTENNKYDKDIIDKKMVWAQE